MAFVKITSDVGARLDAKADGYWLDWDEGKADLVQQYLKAFAEGNIKGIDLVLVEDRPLCILAQNLGSIPQALLNDTRLDGVLFVDKSRVPHATDGSYDVAKLFKEIPYGEPLPQQEPPKAEEWEVDFQGYLVRKPEREGENESDNQGKVENFDQSNPYAAVLHLLDPSLRNPRR